MTISLYNSLTEKLEEIKTLETGRVRIYACGPTVYDFAHIGNFRTFLLADIVNRVFSYDGYAVDFIMNLTDVGHLSGDNNDIPNPDSGEDRLEVAAEKEGRTARDIADFYIGAFYKDYDKLALTKPKKFTRATDYIPEQISLIRTLERQGFTYEISDGIYFDTSKFEGYGALTKMTSETILEGARVEVNPEKKNPMDFALWKYSPKDGKRWQEWTSPWGVGFPGWHIECSAMGLKELGDQIDIHVGGEDLRLHHQNEIAQCEASTGNAYCKMWLHATFLQVDGGKMGKSKGNAYTLSDLEHRGYDPLALRYFYMTGHYRSALNFTWGGLTSAQNSLKRLYDMIAVYKESPNASFSDGHLEAFEQAVYSDLNMPKALAAMWEVLKADISDETKVATLIKMDEVLGFDILNHVGFEVPKQILDLVRTRNEYRKAGIWDKADGIRKEMFDLGFIVEDLPDGRFRVKRA